MSQPTRTVNGRCDKSEEILGSKATSSLKSVSIDQINGESTASYADYTINAKTEIRILNLLPPDQFDVLKIHCTLLIAKLADSPQYEALSYAWGEPIFPERLYLPSGYLAITKNLAAALRHLRYPDRSRRMWVDAVCINQQDDNEKGHQVSLMAQVYRNTQCGLAWLGEGDKDTCKGFAMIKDVAAFAKKKLVFGSRHTYFEAIARLLDEKSKSILVELAKWPNLHLISNVLLLPWFQRLWIVQEAALPSKFTLCLSWNTVGFDEEFVAVLRASYLMYREELYDYYAKNLMDALMLSITRENFQDAMKLGLQPRIPLLEQINLHSSKKCANDMDRIYGLIGLQAIQGGSIEPEYSENFEKVYLDFAYNALQQDRGLSVLHLTARNTRGQKLGRPIGISESKTKLLELTARKLPSWVPDWRYESLGAYIYNQNFAAATQLSPSILLNKGYMPFIGMGGVRVDLVTATLSTIFPEASRLWDLSDFWRESPSVIVKLRDIFLDALPPHRYPTKKHAELVFARTMVQDGQDCMTQLTFPDNDPESLFSAWKLFESTIDIAVGNNEGKIPYKHACEMSGTGRTFVMTKSGYIGIAPLLTEAGDTIVVFDGDQLAFVLKASTQDTSLPHWSAPSGQAPFMPNEQWKLVGGCYLHGFMASWIMRLLDQSGGRSRKHSGSLERIFIHIASSYVDQMSKSSFAPA